MIYIFYLAQNRISGPPPRNSSGWQLLELPGGRFVYIRAALAQSSTVEGALAEARPLPGETVMNTHEIPARRKIDVDPRD